MLKLLQLENVQENKFLDSHKARAVNSYLCQYSDL